MFYPVIATTCTHLFHALVWLRPDLIKRGWKDVARVSMFFRICQIGTLAFTVGKYHPNMNFWVMKAMIIMVGQLLNLSVYYTLGPEGVYYGSLYNKNLPIISGWPFNVCRDPQYVGSVLTLYGIFLLFPYFEIFAINMYAILWFITTAYIENIPQIKKE